MVTKRFPYALFFGHLALEEILKALVVKFTEEHAPYTHSLPLLTKKINVAIPEPMMDQLAEYTEFHLESRYPDDKMDFYKKCKEEFSYKKFEEIENAYTWLIKKLEI